MKKAEVLARIGQEVGHRQGRTRSTYRAIILGYGYTTSAFGNTFHRRYQPIKRDGETGVLIATTDVYQYGPDDLGPRWEPQVVPASQLTIETQAEAQQRAKRERAAQNRRYREAERREQDLHERAMTAVAALLRSGVRASVGYRPGGSVVIGPDQLDALEAALNVKENV